MNDDRERALAALENVIIRPQPQPIDFRDPRKMSARELELWRSGRSDRVSYRAIGRRPVSVSMTSLRTGARSRKEDSRDER